MDPAGSSLVPRLGYPQVGPEDRTSPRGSIGAFALGVVSHVGVISIPQPGDSSPSGSIYLEIYGRRPCSSIKSLATVRLPAERCQQLRFAPSLDPTEPSESGVDAQRLRGNNVLIVALARAACYGEPWMRGRKRSGWDLPLAVSTYSLAFPGDVPV